LLGEPRHISIGIRRLKSDSLTFHYCFDHIWSYKLNCDVIPVGPETTSISFIYDTPFNSLRQENHSFEMGFDAASRLRKKTNLVLF
jgi:hypothetical protein